MPRRSGASSALDEVLAASQAEYNAKLKRLRERLDDEWKSVVSLAACREVDAAIDRYKETLASCADDRAMKRGLCSKARKFRAAADALTDGGVDYLWSWWRGPGDLGELRDALNQFADDIEEHMRSGPGHLHQAGARSQQARGALARELAAILAAHNEPLKKTAGGALEGTIKAALEIAHDEPAGNVRWLVTSAINARQTTRAAAPKGRSVMR